MTKPDFIHTIRQLIADGKTDEAFVIMRANVGKFDPTLVTDVTLLESRFTNVSNDFTLKGILPREDYDRTMAQINYALLEIVEKLEKTAPLSTATAKNKNSGRILHNIPGTMPVGKERRCIVRIAYDDETLLRDLGQDENTTIENVRIAEVMGVELVDFNEVPAFSVRTITEEEQFIVDDDYTQWLFMVKALREGKYPLTLKVSVIEEVNGKERKRDIVLEKEVFIISQLEEPPAVAKASEVVVQPAATHFEDTTIHLNYVSTETNRVAAATSPAAKRFTISGIASAAAVLVMAFTGWVAVKQYVLAPKVPVDVVDNSNKNNQNGTDPLHSPNVSDTLTHFEEPKVYTNVTTEVATQNNGQTANNKTPQPKTEKTKPQHEVAAAPKNSDEDTKPDKKFSKPTNNTSSQGTASYKVPIKKKPVSPKPIPKPDTLLTPTTEPVTQPAIKIGGIKIVPATGGVTTTTEPVLKTFKVRLILKGEMKKAEIFVDGQSVDRFLKKDIWGTPQYIEFKSSKERHTITFKRGNVSCSVENVLVENGNMTVEPCSF
jgi:Effector-associated domain 11